MPRKKSGNFDNKAYQNEYHKAMKTKLISFNPNSPDDMELWDHLQTKENQTGYIKGLILEEKEMKIPEVTLQNFKAERKQIEQSLKPCPFCGNDDLEFALCHPQWAESEDDADYWCFWQILCPECGAEMENARMKDQTWEEAKQEIINNWNHRA